MFFPYFAIALKIVVWDRLLLKFAVSFAAASSVVVEGLFVILMKVPAYDFCLPAGFSFVNIKQRTSFSSCVQFFSPLSMAAKVTFIHKQCQVAHDGGESGYFGKTDFVGCGHFQQHIPVYLSKEEIGIDIELLQYLVRDDPEASIC